MSLSSKLLEMVSIPPGMIVMDQMRRLYYRLYPYMLLDFSHKADIAAALGVIQADVTALKLLYNTHTHPVAGVVATPTPNLSMTSPSYIQLDVVGLANLIPGGVMQPTGQDVAFFPSRVAPDPLTVPPIDPTIL